MITRWSLDVVHSRIANTALHRANHAELVAVPIPAKFENTATQVGSGAKCRFRQLSGFPLKKRLE